ncbi:MAG: hypothetical protein J0H74_01745 [Chitinophagaceae bacterium]|nr:hypothetical protein [Chitinophagaceae bacterium]
MFILSLVTDMYKALSVSFTILLLVMLLDKMGRGIVLREIIAFLYAFTCLLMPSVGYTWYTRANFLARLWFKYMRVPESVYFSFAFPSIALFCLALTLPFPAARDYEQGEGIKMLTDRIRAILPAHKNVAMILLITGTVVLYLVQYLPLGLQYFATLIFFSSFAGLLYLYFSEGFRNKKWIIRGFVAFILYNAISGGMFTIVAYMGINVASFMLLGRKTSFLKKAGIFLLAAVFFIVLQNVKVSFRSQLWTTKYYQGSRVGLFASLFWENLQKGGELITNTDAFFPVYTRANQGFIVSLVMTRIPRSRPFDGGATLAKNFASAFVPRFLWPDKPEAGGKFNMKYYTGYNIEGFSMNVGPLGEAYGSFGPGIGIIYMFLLGLFIRWAYARVFHIARRIPLLVCWVPVLFYQVISSSETDSLTLFNSILKSALFVWLVYKIQPHWFGVKRVSRRRVPRGTPATGQIGA